MSNPAETPDDIVAEAQKTAKLPERFFVTADGQFLGAFAGGAEPPENAVEVPNAPQVAGATWDGSNWQKPPVADPVLNPARFVYLLAYTGLDDAWEALETALRTTDRATFAQLRAQRAKTEFHLNTTLQFVAQHRSTVEAVAPGVDLSEAAIRAAWAQAATATV